MNDLLSIPKAAKLVGMSASWLRGEINAGRLPCIRPGKHRRVERLEVLKLKHPEGPEPEILKLEDNPLDR